MGDRKACEFNEMEKLFKSHEDFFFFGSLSSVNFPLDFISLCDNSLFFSEKKTLSKHKYLNNLDTLSVLNNRKVVYDKLNELKEQYSKGNGVGYGVKGNTNKSMRLKRVNKLHFGASFI
jgi:hypothetical protein